MKMAYFDYTIPDGMDIKIGQLVEIPFRSSTLLGCVSGTTNKSQHKGSLKPVARLLNETPFLSERSINLAIETARVYGVAPSVIITMMLPSLQKRALTNLELKPIIEKRGSSTKKVIRYMDEQSLEEKIKSGIKNNKKQILILAPTLSRLLEVRNYDFDAVSWESTMSVKSKREAWQKIRNGTPVIMGMRSAVFLPLYNLEKILIIDEEEQDHKSWDQAPRYRVHDIAERLGVDVTYFSRTPTFTTVHNTTKKNLSQIGKRKPTNITIADIAKERGSGNYDVVSSTLEAQIRKKVEDKQNVFLFINKKGFAQLLRCRDCGFIFSCVSCFLPYTLSDNKALCRHCKSAAEIPTKCHKCGGITLRYQGTGVQQIAHWAGKEFAHKANIIEWTADDEHEQLPTEKPIIIVGTTAAISNVQSKNIKLFGVVDADHILNIPEYDAAERGLALFVKLLTMAQKSEADFVVQTQAPNHVVFETLISGKLQPFIKTENSVRKQLRYPPYSKLMKIAMESQKAISTLQNLAETIKQNMKEIDVVAYPLLPETRGKNKRYALLCKLDSEKWWKQAQEITPLLKQGMKVDIDPNSLLS